MDKNTEVWKPTKEEIRDALKKLHRKQYAVKRLEESLFRACYDIAMKEYKITGINPDEVKIKLYCKMMNVLFEYEDSLDAKEP